MSSMRRTRRGLGVFPREAKRNPIPPAANQKVSPARELINCFINVGTNQADADAIFPNATRVMSRPKPTYPEQRTNTTKRSMHSTLTVHDDKYPSHAIWLPPISSDAGRSSVLTPKINIPGMICIFFVICCFRVCRGHRHRAVIGG